MKIRNVIFFLAVAFAWSWVNWLLALHSIASGFNEKTFRPFLTFFFIGVYGPTISALLTTICFEGWSGLKALLAKLLIWKTSPFIYITIIFLPLLATMAAVGLYALYVGKVGRFDIQAIHMVPIYIWASLRGGPLGEELGWRGFLLPRMQQQFSPLVSSLIIGLIWFCWHIPLFFAPIGTAVSGAPITILSLLNYYLFVTCLACIYTWLVNRSNGSVLVAILIHWSINAGLMILFFPGLADHSKQVYYFSAGVYALITIVLGIMTRFGPAKQPAATLPLS